MADENLTDKEIRDQVPENIKDIYSKYTEAFYFLQPRKRRQVQQIVLMNNLQRGDENISATLLLTLFNRILSSNYDDKMQVKFVPGEEMDQKKVSSLNILAQNDYREMDMARLDYDWTWDTLFFGRGYMETLRFDVNRKILQPHVINPLVFGYDPFFENPQEWRYYWKWITKSSQEINQLINANIITGVQDAKGVPSGIDPYLWDYKVIRERAKFVTPQADDSYAGDVHQILEFFGYDTDGDKAVYWIDRDFSKILYQAKLNLNDGEDIIGPMGEIVKTNSKWPIVVKEAFREPHSSVNFSVADLLEDKHRARSVLLNLAFLAAKDKANPLYMYNPDKVKDVTQLFSRQIYQHIPVTDVDGAIAPLNTDSALDPSLQAFMNMLNQEASDPLGTGDANGAKKGKDSATHDAIEQQLNDMAQSLQSKLLQFGTADFWAAWYQRYLHNSKEGDIKIATIVGVKGVTFEKIDLGDFKTKYPPGVLVYSAKEAEYKELVERRDIMQILPNLMQTLTPDGMRNFNKYVFFPKFQSLDPQTIEILLPDSLDEIKAAQENERLGNEEMVQVLPTDNHEQHLAVHTQSKNSWAKWIHIQWHEELLAQQKAQMGPPMPTSMSNNVKETINFKDLPPDGQQQLAARAGLRITPAQPAETQGATSPGGLSTPQGVNPQGQASKGTPLQAAASLRDATLTNIQHK